MSEPSATLQPVAALSGLSLVSIWAGMDQGAVIAAFGGALLFCFFAKDTKAITRLMLLIGSWIFGYFASAEIARRSVFGFTTTQIPAFICAFFCVALFKVLLIIFDDSSEGWIRRRLGMTKEEGKGE
jgi:hypothetical protein